MKRRQVIRWAGDVFCIVSLSLFSGWIWAAISPLVTFGHYQTQVFWGVFAFSLLMFSLLQRMRT